MTEFDPIASFHRHAQTFDVYPAGMGSEPAFASDVVTFGQMDRAILEFELPERGRYMFHPHQHSIAQRGAMGSDAPSQAGQSVLGASWPVMLRRRSGAIPA